MRFAIAGMALALTACGPAGTPTATAKASPAPSFPPARLASSSAPSSAPLLSRDEAVKAVYTVSNESKPKEPGVREFIACFQTLGATSKCPLMAFARLDSFEHLAVFTPARSQLNGLVDWTHVGVRVIVPSCGAPFLVLRPVVSREGWLFLEKAQLLTEGSDAPLEWAKDGPVHHEVEPNGHTTVESFTAVATEADVRALKAITQNGNSFAVRLTGSKGYVLLTKDRVKDLRDDLGAALPILDTLRAAVDKATPLPCKKPST